jgi:polyisoprenoid-binding protein YceI
MSIPEEVQAATSSPLPSGKWHVDSSRSNLSFGARGMFGLVPVQGEFREYSGEMSVDDSGARGELRIKAASLDTGNATRDKHLRSPDFFDASNHEMLTFILLSVTDGAVGGLELQGVLSIHGTDLQLVAPLQVEAGSDQITVSTTVEVERAAAGVGWSKAGMIKGPAKIHATLTLVTDTD